MLSVSRWKQPLQAAGLSIPYDEKGEYIIDLQAIRGLLPTFPKHAVHQVAGICENTITPICRSFHGMIVSDIKNITQVLSELEGRYESEDELVIPKSTKGLEQPPGVISDLPSGECYARPSVDAINPLVIPSISPGVPSIVITPCDSETVERSCQVPYQNSAFGAFLTVPSHAPFNEVHPPLLPTGAIPALLDDWVWRNGHWEVVVPSLEAQARNGVFSRPQIPRRRTSRPFSRKILPVPPQR